MSSRHGRRYTLNEVRECWDRHLPETGVTAGTQRAQQGSPRLAKQCRHLQAHVCTLEQQATWGWWARAGGGGVLLLQMRTARQQQSMQQSTLRLASVILHL